MTNPILASLFMLVSSSAFAAAGGMNILPANYAYQEIMPGFHLAMTLKASKPCVPTGKATLVSEDWKKDENVTNKRKGTPTKLVDRIFVVRLQCEAGKADTGPIAFDVANTGKQVEHVHIALLDGLEVTGGEQIKIEKK